MREIKFRQWVKNRFYYWGVGIEGNTFVGPVSGGVTNANNTPQMQFTGLVDKNGKDIYEGDVVKIHYVNPVVGVAFFDEAKGQYLMAEEGLPAYHLSSEDMREVIGNIYENPELVTQ